jgi:hypothetical protein
MMDPVSVQRCFLKVAVSPAYGATILKAYLAGPSWHIMNISAFIADPVLKHVRLAHIACQTIGMSMTGIFVLVQENAPRSVWVTRWSSMDEKWKQRMSWML